MIELSLLFAAIVFLFAIAQGIYYRGFDAGEKRGKEKHEHPSYPVSRDGWQHLEEFSAAAARLGYNNVSVQTREFEDGRACWFVVEEPDYMSYSIEEGK